MTGKQIAANLRGSRRPWGKRRLHQEGYFCVLGIKATEAGVNKKTLDWFDDSPKEYDEFGDSLQTLTELNDRSASKQELIDTLENDYPSVNFPVRRFVRYLLTNQKRGLPNG